MVKKKAYNAEPKKLTKESILKVKYFHILNLLSDEMGSFLQSMNINKLMAFYILFKISHKYQSNPLPLTLIVPGGGHTGL